MILNNFKIIVIFITCLALSSCSLLDTHQLNDTTKIIKIFDDFEHIQQCKYLDSLVGSEGTWYNYLFLSNKELTLGSINDLKNQADLIGANAIYIQYHLFFTTSMTFFAQAYYCE